MRIAAPAGQGFCASNALCLTALLLSQSILAVLSRPLSLDELRAYDQEKENKAARIHNCMANPAHCFESKFTPLIGNIDEKWNHFGRVGKALATGEVETQPAKRGFADRAEQEVLCRFSNDGECLQIDFLQNSNGLDQGIPGLTGAEYILGNDDLDRCGPRGCCIARYDCSAPPADILLVSSKNGSGQWSPVSNPPAPAVNDAVSQPHHTNDFKTVALDAMDGVSGSDSNDYLRFNQYAWPQESSTKRRMQQPSMLVKRAPIPDPAPQTAYEPGDQAPNLTDLEEKKPKETTHKETTHKETTHKEIEPTVSAHSPPHPEGSPAHTPQHPDGVPNHSPPHPEGAVVHGDAPAPHPDGQRSVQTKAARFGKGKKIMAAAAASSLVVGGGVWMYNKFHGKKGKAQKGLQSRDVLDWQTNEMLVRRSPISGLYPGEQSDVTLERRDEEGAPSAPPAHKEHAEKAHESKHETKAKRSPSRMGKAGKYMAIAGVGAGLSQLASHYVSVDRTGIHLKGQSQRGGDEGGSYDYMRRGVKVSDVDLDLGAEKRGVRDSA